MNNNGFKGYTLAELKHKKEINAIEQELVAERLRDAVSSIKQGRPGVASVMTALDTVAGYADIFGSVIGGVRRVSTIFSRLFRRRR